MKLIFYFTTLISLIACTPAASSTTPEPRKADEKTDAKVETYRYADNAPRSETFSVYVNGIKQLVYPTIEPDVCIFGCSDSVYVKIVPDNGMSIDSYIVRPINKHFPASGNTRSVTVKMTAGDRVVVELNGNEKKPLFIFANTIEMNKPSSTDPNVHYFGAGKIHDISRLTLKSNEKAYIEGGAIVNGEIWAEKASNVSISGCGMLVNTDGNNTIRFNNCTSVILRDITTLGKSGWTTFFCLGSKAYLTNYKVVSVFSNKADGTGNENDACDFLGFSDVTAKGGFCYCHDDALCIKSQKWGYSKVTENLHFEDYVLWNNDSGNGIEVGYELNQDVRDISFKNMYVIHSGTSTRAELRRGGIGIHNGAGGSVSGLSYENIYLEDAKEYGIYMRIIKSSYDIGTGVSWTPGSIRNVTFKNIFIDSKPHYGNYISGLDADHIISDVSFDGLHYLGRKITDAGAGDFRTFNFTTAEFR